MIKQLIVVLTILISANAFAQAGTVSPYSFYGIGSLKARGTVENRSMGGMSVYLDSIHVNLKNPASYAGQNLKGPIYNNESRPVKFAVAGAHTETTFKTNNAEANGSSSTFDYIAISFPIGKLGFGFGLLPFTSVGYQLETLNADGNRQNRFEGDGGLNRVFAGLGYSITKELSVGVDFNYNFGNIENDAIAFAYDENGDLVQYQTQQLTRSDLSGITLNIGVAYKRMITDKLELSAMATYSPESDLTSDNQRTLATGIFNPLDGSFSLPNFTTPEDFVKDIDLGDNETTDLTMPSRFSIGAGVGEPKKWFVGAEYTSLDTGNFSNPIYNNQGTNFENSSEITVGGFYIPRYNAFNGYFKRVVYRGGFRYASTGLQINNESINEFGISFGLGLPVGNANLFSNANLGVEFGQRGTTNANLVQENFINFNLSLSLNSRWFQKRKFN